MAAPAGELRVPVALQKARLKAEEKTLDLEFEVLHVRFNSGGRYALRLTAENPLLEGGSGGGVRLRVNDGEAVWSDTGATDVVEQGDPGETCSFRRRKFTFTLPKGFCKNDGDHDARLRIEALRFRGAAGEGGRRAGEAFFAIYPRPNQPRMNLFAGRHEDLYRYHGVAPLLRVGSDRLARHCGSLAFAVSFHEHRPPLAAEPRRSPDAPPPRRSLHAPGSAYRSLPAEGRARSPEAPEQLLADPELGSSPELPGDSADERFSSSSSSSSSSSAPAPRRLLSCSSFHLSSPGYSPDLTSSAVQEPRLRPSCSRTSEREERAVPVPESPAGEEEEEEEGEAARGRRHVAHAGKEAITVTLHGASNLPAPQAGTAPRPYVVVKTSRDEQQKARVTHASSEPTHSPTWEEEVTVEIDAEDAGWEALALTVADRGTKEALATYRLPVRHLQPFRHYHCRLALPRKKDPAGTSLYVTVVRKGSVIPRCEGMDYAGLEVFLEGMTVPLASPPGALVAVASVVASARAYEDGMAKRPAARPGVCLTTVAFPEPSAADFSLPRAAHRGCPQMTSPAGPAEKLTWNTSFLFQGRDGATIFSEDAALAIEYYPHKAMSDAESLLAPLGYSVLPLPPGVYRRLAAERGGLRVDGLPVQGTGLKTASGAAPAVRLCLRLVGCEGSAERGGLTCAPLLGAGGARPALILVRPPPSPPGREGRGSGASVHHLGLADRPCRQSPCLPGPWPGTPGTRGLLGAPGRRRMHPSLLAPDQPAPVPLPLQRPQTFLSPCSRAALPSLHPASLAKPEGAEEPLRPPAPPRPPAQDEPSRAPLGLQQGDVSLPPADAVAGILPGKQPFPRETGAPPEEQRWPDGARDQREQETNNYRLALKRMADDILSLRQHVTSLEMENSKLRRSLAMHEDLGRMLLSDIDVDVMTRAEIVDRIATLKHKLASGTVEMRRLKDRVQQLQNELIRKNDREKDLVMLQRVHQQQQAALRKYQEKMAKMKGLEETVRQQEKVIQTMERMLEERLSGAGKGTEKPAGEALAGELYSTLLAENRKLREELARPRHPSPPTAPPPQALPDVFGSSEKLSLLAKLEKAQARSRVLETQPPTLFPPALSPPLISFTAGGGCQEVGTGEAGAQHSLAGAGPWLQGLILQLCP
ncbi:coiled-coil domain-containing protein 33 [Apteryx mantelli]|uniref:Coiled-coil domain-containing protein 33 n=1 Tax=Apteryx mantelli TaxID=2696672 RepID=A0ABM4FAC3_9AVES